MESFRLFLLRKGVKNNSIALYVATLKRVLKNTSLDSVDSYLLSLLDHKKTPSYLNSVVTTLRLYGQFTNNETLKTLPMFKRRPIEKGILSEEEISAMIALAPEPHIKGLLLRQFHLFSLLWKVCAYSGGRVGEISTLTVANVDFGQKQFRVDGKTGVRTIPINPALIDDLTAHMKTLQGDFVFQSMKSNTPINRAAWHLDFHRRLKRLHIRRPRITPHSLRHSFAVRILDEDINLYTVMNLLGHRNASTTQIYYHYGQKKGQAAIRKDPLGRKQLTHMEKYYAVRDGLRKLLSDYCNTPQEEADVMRELVNST